MSVTSQILSASSGKSVRLTLREARLEDHARVAALEAKFDLAPKSYEEWTHLWLGNPAYRENQCPIGWVLELADGSIVGYLGNIPVHYEFRGRRLLAAVTRAWVVEVAYRSYALSLLSAYFKQPNVDLWSNTSVNSVAGKAYSKVFRGGPVPVGAWDESVFWITKYLGFAESVLRDKKVGGARLLSYPLATAVFLGDRMRGSGLRRTGKMNVIRCPGFDGHFEVFWAALREKKSHMLLAVRSREVLQWHFEFALRERAAWIFAIEDRGKLEAYAIFNRRLRHAAGLTSMRLTDFQCLEEERAEAWLGNLLQAAAERCREESIPMLEMIGLHSRFDREIGRAHPHRRKLSNWRYFYKAGDMSLAEQLRNPQVWDPWLFDGDSAL